MCKPLDVRNHLLDEFETIKKLSENVKDGDSHARWRLRDVIPKAIVNQLKSKFGVGKKRKDATTPISDSDA